MKKLVVLILFFVLILSCQNRPTNNWEVAFKNAKDGTTLQGSKAELINAIRQGLPIKIGWGSKGKNHRIEHLSDPIWLAILDETEVTARLETHSVAVTDWNNLSSSFSDTTKLSQEWRVVLSTKGDFDAVWYDRKTHELVKRVPQNHVMTWFIKKESNDNVIAMPLFEER